MTTLVAFFALLFTGRYPRGIFDFNVGVLRWSWRVGYYASRDRHRPLPAVHARRRPRLPGAARDRLSGDHRRGLPLIGWWLVGIPQYVIAGIIGSGIGFGWSGAHWGVKCRA